jgi:DNA repair photolyase
MTAVITTGAPERDALNLVDEIPECGGWAISPYWRCDIRCTYCITGSQGRSEPRVDPRVFDDRLRAELAAVPHDAKVGIGSFSDAYPSIEAELGLTRRVIVELIRQGRSVTIVTKGTTVVRDLDLLVGHPSLVTISLCSADDDLAAEQEPGAPTVTERLAAAASVHRAGVRTWIAATPWIPGLSDVAEIHRRVRAEVGYVPITVGPVNVRAPQVVASRFGRGLRQEVVNQAYLDERRRVGEHDGLQWLHPLPTAGHHALTAALAPMPASVPVAPPRRRPLATPA